MDLSGGIKRGAWLAAALCLVALSGCRFDHPLTGGPSKDASTWLLGGWDSRDEKGRLLHLLVTPVGADRYDVQLTAQGTKPKETKHYRFEAWPSRVGDTLFLTLRCKEGAGDIPQGAYVFAQAQLLDQNFVRLRGLALESPASASSYELRKEIRAKLKAHSLYEGAPKADWTRVEEVYLSVDGSDPAFRPIRDAAH